MLSSRDFRDFEYFFPGVTNNSIVTKIVSLNHAIYNSCHMKNTYIFFHEKNQKKIFLIEDARMLTNKLTN